jgi:hypothetical protein
MDFNINWQFIGIKEICNRCLKSPVNSSQKKYININFIIIRFQINAFFFFITSNKASFHQLKYAVFN